MKRLPVLSVAAGPALVALFAAIPASAAPSTAAPAATPALATLPALHTQQFTLPNGLRVVVNEDHALPIVAIVESFDVGARDEQQGQFGFAHLFEHLMFEGSANAPKGLYDRYINAHGGDDNAWTSQDFTTYHSAGPSNAFAGLLWLEADRVRALSITAEALANQIKVVEEEFRFRVYNEPYAATEMHLSDAAYAGSAYGHDTLGTFADLDAASLGEVSAFHEGFYGPQNMVLVVTGDVTADEVRKAVTTDFGSILRRVTPPRPDYTVPAHAPVHLEESDKLAEVPRWIAMYRVPASHTPDHDALEVLGEILAGGDSGRLTRLLIDDRRIASSVDAAPDGRRGTDMFTIDATVLDDHTPAEVRAATEQALADIAAHGVDVKEVEKAQNRLVSQLYERLGDRVGRGELFATYVVALGDPNRVLAEPDAWRKVTAADVQRVAATYLVPANRNDAFITPAR